MKQLLLTAALGAACLCAISPRSAYPDARCSLATPPFVRTASFFIATATTDTVYAGEGDVLRTRSPDAGGFGGHAGNGQPRTVFGQITKITVRGSTDTTSYKLGADSLVVIVPWDYDSACEPIHWTRSARWSDVGHDGLYRATLREEKYWVQNRPTFDAFAAILQPYTSGAWGGRNRAGGSPTAMSPREYITLYALLPTLQEYRDRSPGVKERLDAWRALHPDLMSRHPAPATFEPIDNYYRGLR